MASRARGSMLSPVLPTPGEVCAEPVRPPRPGAAARRSTGPRVEGLDNCRPTGPVIIAANHRAVLDTAVISLVARRQVAVPRQSGVLHRPRRCAGRLMAAFVDALGFVPVERGNAHAGLAALNAGQKVLNAGGVFAIYPEGTRSLDGRLYRGHTGVAVLTLTTGAPVVPVALLGTEMLMPRGRPDPALRPRRHPRSASRWTSLGGHRAQPARPPHGDRRVMARSASLLVQQEYVDAYHRALAGQRPVHKGIAASRVLRGSGPGPAAGPPAPATAARPRRPATARPPVRSAARNVAAMRRASSSSVVPALQQHGGQLAFQRDLVGRLPGQQ